MPTAVRPTRDDRLGWMTTTTGATRTPWSNFGHHSIDDWPTGSVVPPTTRPRPCTVGVAPTHRHGATATPGRRQMSAAPGRSPRVARFMHRAVSPDSTDDEPDDMSDGIFSDDSSDSDPEKPTPPQKTVVTSNSNANSATSSQRRCDVQTPVQRAEVSRESAGVCRQDIDNEIKSLWDVGVATKKTMSTMMYLNNGLSLPTSYKPGALVGRRRRKQAQVDQGFSKTTRRKRKPKLPPFYVKPQHRHTSANVFLATRYAALQRSVSSGCFPPEGATVDKDANAPVTFSKLARTQILRRLQERNDIKVETKRKLKESTQMQAKVDSFIASLTKYAQTN